MPQGDKHKVGDGDLWTEAEAEEVYLLE